MRRLIVLAVSLTFLASSLSAATYYVSTSGSDANPGSLSAPFRTITKAAGVARPGDVVNVRGGVYDEVVQISSRGTASAPIVFRSYPGERAVIDGTGSAAGTNLVLLYMAEHVELTGFEVRNATRIGICVWGGRHVRITGNEVHRSTRNGIYAGYSTWGSTSDITIAGNVVRDNVLENQFHTMNGGWAQAIGVSRVERATVADNRIHSNDGEGIAFVLSDNGLARGNEVYDNFSVGIYLDNARYTTVDANLIYSTGNSRYFRNGHPAAGIGTANESYSTSNPITGLTITNNIVVDTRWGFYYGAYEAGGGLKNSTIANNTFYRASSAIVWIEADAHAGNVFQNNIAVQAGGVMHSGTTAGVSFRRNNWYGGSAGAAASGDDIVGDPRLANPGGRAAGDYRLTSGSPAVDASLNVAAVTTDYWRGARSGTHDLGAHELGTGAAPAPAQDTQAPTVPASLKASSTKSGVALSWTASSDNVGVAGYKVYRDGAHVATVTGTTWTDVSGLPRRTTFVYGVLAFDAAGNESAQATVSFRTK